MDAGEKDPGAVLDSSGAWKSAVCGFTETYERLYVAR